MRHDFKYLEVRQLGPWDEAWLPGFLKEHGEEYLLDSPKGIALKALTAGRFQGLYGVTWTGEEHVLGVGACIQRVYQTGRSGRFQEPVCVGVLRHVVVHTDHRGNKYGALLAGHLFLSEHLATSGRTECVVAAMLRGDAAAADVIVKQGLGSVEMQNAFALSVTPGLAPFSSEAVASSVGLNLDTHIVYFRHDILEVWADKGKLMQKEGYQAPELTMPVFSSYLDQLPSAQKADLFGLADRRHETLMRYGLMPGPAAAEQSLTGRYSKYVGRNY